MANTALANDSGDANTYVSTMGDMLPTDPFRSLYVHFGMLLGVEDFRTMDAYHRGKMWFHSGWLHGEGTLWGLQVSLDVERNELRVEAGAAIDGLGRELYLQQAACLNLNAWYSKHKDDAMLTNIVEVDENSGAVTFSGHVVIAFKACLDRQVPALTEPCDGSDTSTAYSRVVETVDLHLVPDLAEQWRSAGKLPYHRVRLLFALEEALLDSDGEVIDTDQEVLDAREQILALPVEQQSAAYLQWLRYFSVLDAMALAPAYVDQGESFSLFPASDPTSIALADVVDITLLPSSTGWALDKETTTGNRVDNTIRPVNIPTSTIQELVCGGAMAVALSPEPPPSPPPSSESALLSSAVSTDAGGPRVVPDSVTVDGELIRFTIANGPLMKASVDTRAICVSVFENRDGWVIPEIQQVTYDAANEQVTVKLRDAAGGKLLRLIVKGTGAQPMMGRNRIPLAGAVGGAPGTQFDGNDFVSMVKIS